MLYLGDTSLSTAACYLAGILHHAGWSCHYRPSDHILTVDDLDCGQDLLILSDYPAARVSPLLQQRLLEQHQRGMSLLMIGGWESYHGLGGDWDKTPLGDILPVKMSTLDDRQNVDGVAVVRACSDQGHPILSGLPWDSRPPIIGGYNRVCAKPESTILLDVVRHTAHWQGGTLQLNPTTRDPLLVIQDDSGRKRACLMTDVAPHWIGPWVDWGTSRVTARYPGAEAIEVGNLYSQFLRQLVAWLLDK